MTTSLSGLADDALQALQMEWLPIKPLTGASWNVGELAIACMRITNTTGLPMRNVTIETTLSGGAADYQPCNTWDGNGGYIGDLDPGETWQSYCALLKATAPGPITMAALVTAEVIPTGTAPPPTTTFTVEPSP